MNNLKRGGKWGSGTQQVRKGPKMSEATSRILCEESVRKGVLNTGKRLRQALRKKGGVDRDHGTGKGLAKETIPDAALNPRIIWQEQVF